MSDPSLSPKQIVLSSADPSVAHIVEALVKKRPIGWSHTSQASYYKQRYALWIKKNIDAMIADKKTRVYRYDVWTSLSHNSLYFRINQSVGYLLDNLDPNGIYKEWKESIDITRKAGIGVIMRYQKAEDVGYDAEVISEDTLKSRPRWMETMDKWLEIPGAKDPFIREGLILTNQQVEQIKMELSGVEGLMISVTNQSVKILKV
jgi:hypothetical protein